MNLDSSGVSSSPSKNSEDQTKSDGLSDEARSKVHSSIESSSSEPLYNSDQFPSSPASAKSGHHSASPATHNGAGPPYANCSSSPVFSPYSQGFYQTPYVQQLQDWASGAARGYRGRDGQIQGYGQPHRRFSYTYNNNQVGQIVPFMSPVPGPSSDNWRAHSGHPTRRNSWTPRFQAGPDQSVSFPQQRNYQNPQLLAGPMSAIPSVYPQAANQHLNNAIALAQVAQQAAIQSSSRYGSSSPTTTSGFPTSPNKLPSEAGSEALAKIAAGKPIPPPVPSLFTAPTFEEALENKICERFGKIASSKAILDAQTNSCKGFGFACFVNEEDATLCIAGLIHYGYQVSFAKESFSTRLKNLQDPQSTNLYLSNLPTTMHEKDLENLFQPYKVVSNRILRDSNNASRGVGFARMNDRESAEAIIAKFDNTPIDDDPSSLPLQIRFADSPSQKRLKNQTQKRRLWRAREYNILTGNATIEDGPFDCAGSQSAGGMLLLNPLSGMPYVHMDSAHLASFQGYPPTPQITAYSPETFEHAAQPRFMPDGSHETPKSDPKSETDSADHVADRLGSTMAI